MNGSLDSSTQACTLVPSCAVILWGFEHDCSVGYQGRGSNVELIKETDFKP